MMPAMVGYAWITAQPNRERRATLTHPTSSLCTRLDQHALRKNLLDLGVAVGDALLVHIAQELLQGRPVLLDTERKRVAAEHVAHAARIDRQPRQRIARHRLLEHAPVGAVLRFVEGVVEAARHPGILIEDRALHRN